MRIALLSSCVCLASCATLQHGWVLGRDGERVEVRLGTADGLTPGDRVDFFDFRCEDKLWALGETTECTHVRVGSGTVLSVAGESSTVRVDAGVPTYWSQHAEPALKTH
jgi:hypothetical protein